MRRLGLLVLTLTACDGELQRVDTARDPGAAVMAWEDAARSTRHEVFAFGTDTQSPVADYLFVIDGSVSMNVVLDRVREGFAQLAAENPFPEKARIAVMSTLPADPARPGALHPAVKATPGLAKEPGFGRLVDAESIRRYRSLATPEVAARFAQDGCDAWFAPTDTNAAGVPCLVAHTQIGLAPVRAEAGLTALSQLLERSARNGRPVFRPGAAVNVIFVSDTHDPGLDPLEGSRLGDKAADLYEHQPGFADLRDRILATQAASSVRIHAMAPRTPCSESFTVPSYFEVTEAAGGESLDICADSDYAAFIRDVARKGAVPQAGVFPVGRPVDQITSVEVDGRPVSYTVVQDRVVLVPVAVPSGSVDVDIQYTWDRTSRIDGHGRVQQRPGADARPASTREGQRGVPTRPPGSGSAPGRVIGTPSGNSQTSGHRR